MRSIKSQKVNLKIRLGDKYMLHEVAVAHGILSLTELIVETIRREAGYEVFDEFDQIVDVGKPMMDIRPEFPYGEEFKRQVILCFSVTLEEIKKIQGYAREKRFQGVPTMVLELLRRKGFISSISETTEVMDGKNSSMPKA